MGRLWSNFGAKTGCWGFRFYGLICEKQSNSGNNIWKNQIHYHLYCFHSLTRKEQQQLLAVVNLNSAVDDDEKEGLKRALGDFWGDN